MGCVETACPAAGSIRTRGPPTFTIWPGAARIVTTVPVTGEGISMFALSVRISTSGSSSLTWSPSATSQRTTSPSAIPSPTSGSFSSIGMVRQAPFGRERAYRK